MLLSLDPLVILYAFFGAIKTNQALEKTINVLFILVTMNCISHLLFILRNYVDDIREI